MSGFSLKQLLLKVYFVVFAEMFPSLNNAKQRTVQHIQYNTFKMWALWFWNINGQLMTEQWKWLICLKEYNAILHVSQTQSTESNFSIISTINFILIDAQNVFISCTSITDVVMREIIVLTCFAEKGYYLVICVL